jgi:hypothetical protein
VLLGLCTYGIPRLDFKAGEYPASMHCLDDSNVHKLWGQREKKAIGGDRKMEFINFVN